MRLRIALISFAATASQAIRCPSSLSWTLLPTNSAQQFRGLSALSDTTAWVAGTNGTVLLTTDAGQTWASVGPPLAPEDATLQFRDVEAFSARHAVVLSIGEGNASRVYVTSDGGKTWDTSFVNDAPTAFYDCLAFDGPNHGLAMSDPVDGKFRIIESTDGGRSWAIVDPTGMPPALTGEAAFAASGQCLTSGPGGRWYLASGGVNPGRLFRTADARIWEVTGTPITGSESAGVNAVQFRDEKNGVIVGGDFSAPNVTSGTAAWSADGGATWTASTVFPGGYRSGVAWISGSQVAIAVGITGSDISYNGGKTWRTFSNGTFDTVQCPTSRVCWASGRSGRVARLDLY